MSQCCHGRLEPASCGETHWCSAVVQRGIGKSDSTRVYSRLEPLRNRVLNVGPSAGSSPHTLLQEVGFQCWGNAVFLLPNPQKHSGGGRSVRDLLVSCLYYIEASLTKRVSLGPTLCALARALSVQFGDAIEYAAQRFASPFSFFVKCVECLTEGTQCSNVLVGLRYTKTCLLCSVVEALPLTTQPVLCVNTSDLFEDWKVGLFGLSLLGLAGSTFRVCRQHSPNWSVLAQPSQLHIFVAPLQGWPLNKRGRGSNGNIQRLLNGYSYLTLPTNSL